MLSIRIWHWLNFFLILGLLGTVFLRKTFLSYKTNSLLIEQKLAEIGITISHEQGVMIAKAIRTPMWEWHYIFGFALAVLFIYRLFIGFKKEKIELSKDGFKNLLHVMFYIVSAFMIISGIVLYFEKIEFLKELHEMSMYFFVAFIPLHVVGVVMHEREHGGLISKMIRDDNKS